MIIGVTGSFGSGKTTVANMFKKYGFRVINADRLYQGIYKKNRALKNKIKKEFGTLGRSKIKKIVFNDCSKLRKLNEIAHPIIIQEIKNQIKNIKKQNAEKIINKKLKNKTNGLRIVIDAPLLIEAKAMKLVNKIVVVKCGKKEQVKRILKKKKYSKKEIGQIMKSQIPLKEKIKYADFVVDNSRTIEGTERQVKKIACFLQKP
ncbi:dephospho-CoA kinase [Candidatus Woesearchaeota archaeon]|nr:dephospho-CoA kinase [Candidatus Woesearchaeota archaeon]